MTVIPEGGNPPTLHLHMGLVWHVRIILFCFSFVYQKSCHIDLSIAVSPSVIFDIPKKCNTVFRSYFVETGTL